MGLTNTESETTFCIDCVARRASGQPPNLRKCCAHRQKGPNSGPEDEQPIGLQKTKVFLSNHEVTLDTFSFPVDGRLATRRPVLLSDCPKWLFLDQNVVFGNFCKIGNWGFKPDSHHSPNFVCSPIVSDRNIWRLPAAQFQF